MTAVKFVISPYLGWTESRSQYSFVASEPSPSRSIQSRVYPLPPALCSSRMMGWRSVLNGSKTSAFSDSTTAGSALLSSREASTYKLAPRHEAEGE